MAFDSATASAPNPTGAVFFDRGELDLLLRLYGRMVGAGLWRDYAIDARKDVAVFSVFRRSCETPVYRIEKRSPSHGHQGPWTVTAPGGLVLRRGHDLAQVLRVLERARFAVVE